MGKKTQLNSKDFILCHNAELVRMTITSNGRKTTLYKISGSATLNNKKVSFYQKRIKQSHFRIGSQPLYKSVFCDYSAFEIFVHIDFLKSIKTGNNGAR